MTWGCRSGEELWRRVNGDPPSAGAVGKGALTHGSIGFLSWHEDSAGESVPLAGVAAEAVLAQSALSTRFLADCWCANIPCCRS